MSSLQTIKKKNKLLEFIFYGNFFYGICAAALSVEASLQQSFPLNGSLYFVLVFFITVLYYAYPYIRKTLIRSKNPRTNWYSQHYNLMRWNQILITAILLFSVFLFFKQHEKALLRMSIDQWLLILTFPTTGALYYGTNFLLGKYSLRKIGWLKPFIIGFTWAGLVTVYPVLFYDIINQQEYQLNWTGGLLFLKNFMFVSVLCIMFDIKDYAVDYIARLKTFVVKLGLRKTIFYILLPLSLTGLVSFIFYAETHQFHQMRILLNIIPFILLALVVWSLRKRRSLLYYLCIVDGLMLIKAICGSIAITCF